MPPLARLADAQRYDHVYLSPHPDDAALSCGGALAALVAEGRRVLVVTVSTRIPSQEQAQAAFGGPPPLWARWSARRSEDAAALGLLGVDWLWLDELDAPLRCPDDYAQAGAVFGPPVATDPLPERMRGALDVLARGCPNAHLHAPLGVGGHVDHRICHAAAGASPGWSLVSYYEDFPYVAARPDALQRRLAELPLRLAPTLRPAGPHLEARVRAIAAYRSQLPMLFGGDEGMVRAVVGWAQQVGGGEGFAEREWGPRAAD